MKKIFISSIIPIFALLLVACSSSQPNSNDGLKTSSTNSSSSINSNSSDNNSPYTAITLTEAGAARVNAAIERQNKVRQALAKYSNWLTPNFLSIQSLKAVEAGDEVEGDMNFEIYPSDSENLDNMFLIGRTKPSSNSSETKGSIDSLIEITSNIPKEEIADYSLNGQISYINGSGDVNHDKIQFDRIPYQQETEFTMTYTYIKKGTAATSSPYSCQPSFNVTKVDNEAPKRRYSSITVLSSPSISYAKTIPQIKELIVRDIKNNFTVNDYNLEMFVSILVDDASLEQSINESINTAKNSANHQFLPVLIPFTIGTVNASTEQLDYKINLVDDIAPAVLNVEGEEVGLLELNGGTNLKLPHHDVVNKGVNQLLKEKGYCVIDDIEGETDLLFDISQGRDDYGYYGFSSTDPWYVSITLSVNKVNKTFLDKTTVFTLGVSPYHGKAAHAVDKNEQIWYYLDYNSNSHFCEVELSTPEQDVAIINDSEIINKNTAFEEELFAGYFNGGVWATNVLILNLSNPVPPTFWISIENTTTVYFKASSAASISLVEEWYGDSYWACYAKNVYTDAPEYSSSWYCNNIDSSFYLLFFGPILGELSDIHYNYSLEQFMRDFNINY